MTTLSPDYEDFLLRCAKHFRSIGFTDADSILKVVEEAGEVAEAWIRHQGLKPRRDGVVREIDVARELADVAMAAMVAMIQLGFQPSHLIEWQREKMEQYLP